jgi:hypothetical protein
MVAAAYASMGDGARRREVLERAVRAITHSHTHAVHHSHAHILTIAITDPAIHSSQIKVRETCSGGTDHPDLPKLLSQLAQAVGEAGDAAKKKELLVRYWKHVSFMMRVF